jgi:hypothetical protein
MTGHSSLRADLAQMSLGFRSLNRNIPGAWFREEFVLRCGIDCFAQPLPKGYRLGIPKMCFRNAWFVVRRRPALRYCEGFVSHRYLPFPIHHGWAIDAENRVIDPTLRDPEDHVYVGVPIEREDAMRRQATEKVYSMFINDVGVINADYMLQRCPELRELMPQAA